MSDSDKLAATFHGAGDRACDHGESMYGRCVSCGMTWEQQAAAREAAAELTPEQDAGQVTASQDGAS